MYSLTFCVRVMFHSNATRTPIANPPNSAQLGGIPYHYFKLHPGPCNSVGMRPRTTDTQTDTQTRVTRIHFASSTTHAKCNDDSGLQHPTGGLTTQEGWLGVRVGGHQALSILSSNKPSKLSQWLCKSSQHHKRCHWYYYTVSQYYVVST